jgi:nucleoside-diphosphate-sugar epimerase
LIEKGHSIFALARSVSASQKIEAMGAIPVDGDLESGKPLALQPVDAVVHAAALFRFPDPANPSSKPMSMAPQSF